jgi:probable F420-dependent oxidoreductase
MRIGISCTGIGLCANEAHVRTSAQSAEEAGFSTIWFGEHVVLFGRYPRSRSPDGSEPGGSPFPDPAMAFSDPVTLMTHAAAVTRTINVGTGIMILPQRNPVVLAKQLATADMLSGGRITIGAGLGWAREEYEACGVPWKDRGKRMDEYLQAMRTLWRDKASTFQGDTVSFEDAYCFPKPVNGDIPILVGGESDAALRRAARYGDGWFAFSVTSDEAASRVALLHDMTREEGRDPSRLRLAMGIFEQTPEDVMKQYRDAGFTELFLMIYVPPVDPGELSESIKRLGDRFVNTAARL